MTTESPSKEIKVSYLKESRRSEMNSWLRLYLSNWNGGIMRLIQVAGYAFRVTGFTHPLFQYSMSGSSFNNH